jgi:hypothetical protein
MRKPLNAETLLSRPRSTIGIAPSARSRPNTKTRLTPNQREILRAMADAPEGRFMIYAGYRYQTVDRLGGVVRCSPVTQYFLRTFKMIEKVAGAEYRITEHGRESLARGWHLGAQS